VRGAPHTEVRGHERDGSHRTRRSGGTRKETVMRKFFERETKEQARERAVRAVYPGGRPWDPFVDDARARIMGQREDAGEWLALFDDTLRRMATGVFMSMAEGRLTADDLRELNGRAAALVEAAERLRERLGVLTACRE